MWNKGFTILEVLVTMLIITIGGLAAYAMVQQIVFSTFASSYRLTAAYLAKEGVENVRNIRDANWLDPANPAWNDGLVAGDWEADYTTENLTDNYDGDFLNIVADFYSYSAGTPTRYKRKITIDNSGLPDYIKVSVEVEWTERGNTHTITVQENLYNWY